MAERKLIEGVEVEMGGETWVLPPLSLGRLRKLKHLFENFNSASHTQDEMIDATVELVHAALIRNYPDMTKERVEDDLLDLGNFMVVLNKLCNISGLTPKGHDLGEAESPTQQVA